MRKPRGSRRASRRRRRKTSYPADLWVLREPSKRLQLQPLLIDLLDEVRQVGAKEKGVRRFILIVVQLVLVLLAVKVEGTESIGQQAAARPGMMTTSHGRLTGAHLGQLRDALADAFTGDELEQLVRIHLDEDLEHIVGPASLRYRVFKLIAWVERMGRTYLGLV